MRQFECALVSPCRYRQSNFAEGLLCRLYDIQSGNGSRLFFYARNPYSVTRVSKISTMKWFNRLTSFSALGLTPLHYKKN